MSARTRAGRLLLAALAAGCAHAPASGPPACPVVPVASAELPSPLRLRARLRFQAEGRSFHLEAVAQRSGDELVVVGLASFGLRLFSLRQRGRELRVEDASPELGPLPLWTADALHRVAWIAAPPDATSWEREGERVDERRLDGMRVREFSRPGGGPPGRVTIEYARPGSDGSAAEIRIRNPWCGYEAVMAQLEGAPADPAAAGPKGGEQ